MTENEALEKHKEDCRRCKDKACTHGVDCLQKKDIEVCEELQAYRAIGTVEEIEKSMRNVSVLLAEHELLKLYQSIGTIEEFKALKEEVELYRNLDKTNFSDGYNKAIDEFAERLKAESYSGYVTLEDYCEDTIESVAVEDICKIAEELKGVQNE